MDGRWGKRRILGFYSGGKWDWVGLRSKALGQRDTSEEMKWERRKFIRTKGYQEDESRGV